MANNKNAPQNFPNKGLGYQNLTRPTDINLNFIVDHANGNGLGVRSIKSNGYVADVYMNSTPAATTSSSVFGVGATTLGLSRNVNDLVVGMVVTDSTTGGNIAGGTTITHVSPSNNSITISTPTLGASASSPGDTLSFAMTPALAGNPNPAVGFALIKLKGNFARYINGFGGAQAPLTATSTTSTTAGSPYVITSLGTTTLAQWQTAGLPAGFVPAVGSSFIALATEAIGGTGTVGVSAASPVQSIQVVGDPNQTLNNSNTSANGGAEVLLMFTNETGAITPADNTVVGLTMRFDGSSVNVDGL